MVNYNFDLNSMRQSGENFSNAVGNTTSGLMQLYSAWKRRNENLNELDKLQQEEGVVKVDPTTGTHYVVENGIARSIDNRVDDAGNNYLSPLSQEINSKYNTYRNIDEEREKINNEYNQYRSMIGKAIGTGSSVFNIDELLEKKRLEQEALNREIEKNKFKDLIDLNKLQQEQDKIDFDKQQQIFENEQALKNDEINKLYKESLIEQNQFNREKSLYEREQEKLDKEYEREQKILEKQQAQQKQKNDEMLNKIQRIASNAYTSSNAQKQKEAVNYIKKQLPNEDFSGLSDEMVLSAFTNPDIIKNIKNEIDKINYEMIKLQNQKELGKYKADLNVKQKQEQEKIKRETEQSSMNPSQLKQYEDVKNRLRSYITAEGKGEGYSDSIKTTVKGFFGNEKAQNTIQAINEYNNFIVTNIKNILGDRYTQEEGENVQDKFGIKQSDTISTMEGKFASLDAFLNLSPDKMIKELKNTNEEKQVNEENIDDEEDFFDI